MRDQVDVLIIGAGIAGSSLAYELAADASVLLLEREPEPGYHSTGRSAAMLTETYGTATVRTLAIASRNFLANPPPGFSATPLLSPRSMLHIARADQRAALEDAHRRAVELVPSVQLLDRASVCAAAPLLDPDYAAGGLLEPESMAIDVAALHQGYLRGLRQRGGRLRTDTVIQAITRRPTVWQVDAPDARFTADVLVDAAGAWADEVAAMANIAPIGLVPKRRTAVLLDPPIGLDPAAWPMVIDVDEHFYFKPEGGQLLVSPADETPVAPCDVQPEEIDVAHAVDRYQRVTGRSVRRIAHRWAGLRSFVADHGPVVGPDHTASNFVWLAGQGGFGIMTAPALARVAASLVRTGTMPADVDLDPAAVGPGRCRAA